MALAFGYASGFLWLLSSAAWLWSAWTTIPVERSPHENSDFEGIEMYVGEPATGGGMFINGMRPPRADEFFRYQRTVLFRNSIAAVTSALAALCACVAVFLTVPSS